MRSITSNKKLITSDEAYWALAGEVEARNAEERSYMNKRERRNTPLDKTEDERYPRERQIVVDSFGNPYSREGSESYNQSLNLPFSPDELTTESGRPIDEAGLSEMLLTPDGSRTLGNIDSKTARIAGILPGTIQANVGVLRHAERQHGKQIINAGYSDVKTFMLHVLNNWSEIREGSNNSLWLVMPKDEGHAGVSAIQLHQDEENVYRVSTLLFARNRSLKNRRLLFAGRPSPAASSGSDMNLTRAPYDFSGRNTAKGVLSEKQSPEESLNSNVLDVNNNGFITPDKLERYNQAMLHGTGHIVLGNRFDLSKIGTGETHQAFGWGAYLAQAMGVAETYRKYGTKLASPDFNINVKTKDGKTYSLSSRSRNSTTYAWRGKPDNYLKRVLERLGDEIRVSHNISLDEAKSRVAKEINAELERWRSNFYINVDKDTIQDNIEDNEKCLEALETINSFDVEEKEGRYGNIYRFDGPENDVLLDYDETLDNQPEHVKKAIEKIRRFVKWCGQNKYISINFILRGEFFEE